ncbi:hypothetical protein [Draconibacterium orientale]|jgi:hypothetical protein|nr:hypothetical protein [Draconibacterium orientale]
MWYQAHGPIVLLIFLVELLRVLNQQLVSAESSVVVDLPADF